MSFAFKFRKSLIKKKNTRAEPHKHRFYRKLFSLFRARASNADEKMSESSRKDAAAAADDDDRDVALEIDAPKKTQEPTKRFVKA